MSGEKNLIPMNKRSKEEARELGRKGGQKSGEARRKKRDLNNIVKMMMDADLNDQGKEVVETLCGEMPEDALTVNALVVAGQIKSAYEGNTKAFQALKAPTGYASVLRLFSAPTVLRAANILCSRLFQTQLTKQEKATVIKLL